MPARALTAVRVRERLVALFLLGVVLLLPPILLVFNHPVRVLGIPLLYLYIFLAWVVLIAIAAAVSRMIEDDGPIGPPETAADGRTEDAGHA